MENQLSPKEKLFLDNFLENANEQGYPSGFSSFYAVLISILGLILIVAVVIITLRNMSDRVVFWVFVPGVISGIGIFLFGLFLLNYLQKRKEQEKLAAIIKKLL